MRPERSSAVVAESAVGVSLDSLFARWARSDRPGLAVGVRHRGRTIYRRAFGMASLETGRALTTASRIRIGSTSKHMTALLALLLAERGLLDLDAPVRTHLPELDGPGGEPTIRQLLRHTGGSRCYFDLSTIAHLLATLPQGRALELQVRQRDRNFEPGTAMIYNNGGYHLVSIACERAANRPFDALLEDELFRPLGMADTRALPSDLEIVPGMATLHEPDGEGWRRGVFPVQGIRGEGSVLSTVDDMLKWTAHLLARDQFGSERTWRELVERPVFPDGAVGDYALGLIHGEHRGRRTLFHAGGVIGGLSQMLLLPDDGVEIVILANGAPDANPIELAEQVVDVLLGTDEPDPAPSLPEGVAGTWICETNGMVYSVGDVGNRPSLGLCGGEPVVPLRATPDGRLSARSPSTGEVLIDPVELPGSVLRFRFGGEEERFRRPEPNARGVPPTRPFACHDAFCAASFATNAGRDLLRTIDALGSNEYALEWLSARMAVATATRPELPFKAVVLLDEDGMGFTLNTSRTRWLRFDSMER